MLATLLSRWQGKFFILCLLGFVTTDFVITITLSAADATAHVIENPFAPEFFEHHRVGITLALVGTLGAVFFKGLKEAIGIAVLLVALYLTLNLVVISVGWYEIARHPGAFEKFVAEAARGTIRLIANERDRGDVAEYG